MGMTINVALETIKGERWIACQEKYIEAMNLITDIVNKYQKIEQIYQKWNEVNDFSYNQAMRKIGEVIEDGNDN